MPNGGHHGLWECSRISRLGGTFRCPISEGDGNHSCTLFGKTIVVIAAIAGGLGSVMAILEIANTQRG
jgi:hypothetical protein